MTTQHAEEISPSDTDRFLGIVSKVPQVTLLFWVIKILATTVGETGGDALSMTLNLGYAVSTLIFLTFFVVGVAIQVIARRYHPFLYWFVVVTTTTVGTTMSDYLDRTLGLGYIRSSIILFLAVLALLFLWRRFTGAIKFEHITKGSDEVFYWVAILVSNTLGTALGDCVADDTGLGFQRGALIFAGLLVLVAAAHFFTGIPKSTIFWSAYVLTRPLGATLGDTLTKPLAMGGLNLSRITSSLVLAALMIVGILISLRNRKHSMAAGERRQDPAPSDPERNRERGN
ncbi:MAG: hypothetical protein ABI718_04305 [Acidobacteriota bacterium]